MTRTNACPARDFVSQAPCTQLSQVQKFLNCLLVGAPVQEVIVDPKRQPDPISFGGLGALRVGGDGDGGGGPEPAGAAAAESPFEASSSGAGAGAGGSSLGPLALATEGSGGVVSWG